MKRSRGKGSRGCLIAVLILGIILLIFVLSTVGLLRITLYQASATVTPQPATSIVTDLTIVPLPPFPWPPPEPSTIASLTLGSVGQASGAGATFRDVDARISNALATAGYDEKSYYGVPQGFAIVTRLEQMNSEGYPEFSDRWVSSIAPLRITEFSLTKYLQALFGVAQGHYRVFVFIVTSDIVVQSGTPVSQGQAGTWFIGGANKLPIEMEAWPYTENHTCTVYIYEFVQSGVGENANQNIPSTITGRQHLERAGLWDILEK